MRFFEFSAYSFTIKKIYVLCYSARSRLFCRNWKFPRMIGIVEDEVEDAAEIR